MSFFIRHKSILAMLVILCMAAALTSCAAVPQQEITDEQDTAGDDIPEDSGDEEPSPVPHESEAVGYSRADSIFTVTYSPDHSLNPIYGTNTYNCDVFSLVYEGLFRLTDDFTAEPVLCTDWHSEDGKTFYFDIKKDVYFHNGALLTAADVEYTINLAAGGNKYKSRLSGIITVNALDDDTLVIMLKKANYNFPALLDIPIVASGTGADDMPSGTGPYRIRIIGDKTYLRSFLMHRDYDKLPVDTIYLHSVNVGGLAENFASRAVDVVNYDSNGIAGINLHMEYETRYYNTTDLIYFGFNTDASATCLKPVRRAISRLIDPDEICSVVFGKAVARSPLIMSPVLPWYDTEWEDGTGHSQREGFAIFADIGMQDLNGDGYLDYPATDPGYVLTVIVNEESSVKVAAASMLVNSLRSSGLAAELIKLPWSEYLTALSAGDFNIYVGEARLRPDFDMSALFTKDGALNYGGVDDENYDILTEAFLAAGTEEELYSAAEELCTYVKEDASIIPLAYKKYSVLSHVGVCSGLEPSVSGLFGDIAHWKINLD